jgi:hypothetical protein
LRAGGGTGGGSKEERQPGSPPYRHPASLDMALPGVLHSCTTVI